MLRGCVGWLYILGFTEPASAFGAVFSGVSVGRAIGGNTGFLVGSGFSGATIGAAVGGVVLLLSGVYAILNASINVRVPRSNMTAT